MPFIPHHVISVCESALYLRGRQLSQWFVTEGFSEESPAEHRAEVFGHDSLLVYRTVVLYGENNGIRGRLQEDKQKNKKKILLRYRNRIECNPEI